MLPFFTIPFAQQSYAWHGAWRSLCQQKITALLIIFVIGLSLALPTTGYILWKNAQSLQRTQVIAGQITLFLKSDISATHKQQLLEKLKKDQQFDNVVYRSAKDNLAALNNAQLLDNRWLTDVDFPGSIILNLRHLPKNSTAFIALRQQLQALKGVESVQLEENFLQKIVALQQLLYKIVILLLGLTTLSILLIIVNSLHAEVYRQQKTIEIMQLLGATKHFILQPFLLQGGFLLTASALLAWASSAAATLYIEQQIKPMTTLFHSHFQLQHLNLTEGLVLVIVSAMLGYLVTWITTSRAVQQLHNNKHSR